MKKIIIVLIILVGNFVNLYYMGQNAEKESEQELSVTNFENVQNDNAIIEEKEKDLNIADINETKENNSIKKSEDCLPVFALFISFAHHHTSKQNSE